MKPEDATKDQLLEELQSLRQRVAELTDAHAQRTRAERALRTAANLHRTLLANLPQKVFLKDQRSVYVYCNERYAADLGIAPGDIPGKTDYDFFPPDLAGKYRDDDKRIVQSRQTEELEEKYVQDTAESWVHTLKTPVEDEHGNVTGIFGIFWDITERRQLQERLVRRERLAALGELAGGVAHELRNPLGAIKNAAYFLDMALERPAPAIKESLQIIEREVETSDGIISSLLDFARPKAPSRKKVKISDVLQDALSHAHLPESVEVVVRPQDGLPAVPADPDQLVHVFSNLILNAAQAMPDGGRLTIAAEARNRESLAVRFTDTGSGIPKSRIPKVFEPLFTTKATGIGLGLALSRMLVERHGGAIEVESEPGRGSTFTVRLPMNAKERK